MTAPREKVALVTGAASGIGAEVARRLAADGCRVGVLDRSLAGAEAVASEIRALGAEALALNADVADPAEVADAVTALADAFGGLHVLVSNAGFTRDAPLGDMSDDDFSAVIDVHLRGAFHCIRSSQVYMTRAQYGRIVCISSRGAIVSAAQANYSAAKAGLHGLTRSAAAALGPLGVTANVVAPGFIETPAAERAASSAGLTLDELRADVAAQLPVRRGGLPSDVAHAVCFLASEHAGFITGQVLYVDGGRGLI